MFVSVSIMIPVSSLTSAPISKIWLSSKSSALSLGLFRLIQTPLRAFLMTRLYLPLPLILLTRPRPLEGPLKNMSMFVFDSFERKMLNPACRIGHSASDSALGSESFGAIFINPFNPLIPLLAPLSTVHILDVTVLGDPSHLLQSLTKDFSSLNLLLRFGLSLGDFHAPTTS